MTTDTTIKHHDDKKTETKEEKHAKRNMKHQAAEALDETQWHKHPGGG